MSDPNEIPEALVEPRRRVSLVWLVPLVALVTGAFVAYRALTERGPAITITFRNAGGLEAGKTHVQYKGVNVGMIEAIALAPDLAGVICHVRMAKGMESHLNEGTQFWVVRARLAGGQVSGLGTLLGGAYLGMHPGHGRQSRRAFHGLDVAPIVTADEKGRRFVLRSYRAGHIEVGTPVFYRKIEVGRVVASELDRSGDFVEIKVFVNAPYDARVRRDSHFWDASGIDVSVGTAGFQIRTESLVGIVIGGIAFDAPSDTPGDPAEEGTVFTLYESFDATRKPVYTRHVSYLLYFPDQSLRGLNVGASVEFRGIVIGQVADVKLEYDAAAKRVRIPIVIDIEPERVQGINMAGDGDEGVMEQLVEAGVRAQLKSGSLLTGQRVVSLDVHKDAPPARIIPGEPHAQFPTVPAPFDEITTSLSHIAQHIEKMPLEQIGQELNSMLRQVNRDLVPHLRKTLTQASGTLASVGPDSQVNADLRRMLSDLADAARALELTAEELEREPQSVIFGK